MLLLLALVGCMQAFQPVADSPAEVVAVDEGPSTCKTLGDAVKVAADAGAACSSDDECAVRHVGQCALGGLDCYSAHYNTSLPHGPLDRALVQYKYGCRRDARCRCAEPTESVCREGRCQRP